MIRQSGAATPSVLFIQSWLQLGGAENLVIELALELAGRGHRVAIACTYVDDSFLDKDPARVRLLRPWRWISWLSRRSRLGFLLLGCPALIVVVLAHARAHDVINPHNFPSFWAAAIASILFQKPVVWHFNEPAPGPRIFLRVDRALVTRATSLTVLDERSKARVRKLFRRDAVVIHPGVDIAFWSQADDAPVPQLQDLRGRSILLAVGKLHRQKNQAVLVRALDMLKTEIRDLTLVLTGDGPERSRLEQLIQDRSLGDRVIFTGMLSSRALRALYRQALLVCFPALDQTWGLTPFEALCQRTVSLVSNQTGAAEVLGPLNIGLLAAPDPASFANEIRTAYQRRSELAEMASRGFDYVASHLSWQRFADEMLAVFANAHESASSGSKPATRAA